MEFSLNVINNNSDKIKRGVQKYLGIMNAFRLCDVSSDYTFQRKFKGFYRVRRNNEFCRIFFNYMESQKDNRNIKFIDVISYIYSKTGRIEPSFSSKMLATINANAPVWDSHVLSQLSIKPPVYSHTNRLQATIDTYNVLEKWYTDYLQTQNANDIISCFDTLIQSNNLTNVKKIDLVLWCMGLKE